MTEVYRICKLAMECIVSDNYEPLRTENALTRVSESDIKRVLAEYNPIERPVMPPDGYFEKAAYINIYTDRSGYHVDIILWYGTEESDLTLQLDMRKKDNRLVFIIDDLKGIDTMPEERDMQTKLLEFLADYHPQCSDCSDGDEPCITLKNATSNERYIFSVADEVLIHTKEDKWVSLNT